MSEPLVEIADAWGRPAHIRPSEVAIIEGAFDPFDRDAQLLSRPVTSYYRVTLRGGTVFYMADTGSFALLAALGLR